MSKITVGTVIVHGPDLPASEYVTPRHQLTAVYSVVPLPPETDVPEDCIDEIVAAALEQAQRDYDALPRWKQRWYVFLTKTGLWRVLRFLGRYTPSALRLRWYYWRHREELEEEYGPRSSSGTKE